jgi:hypothetical protein
MIRKLRKEDKMQQWEYKIAIGDLGELELNEIGKDGWEMCGAVQQTSPFATLYFKREKTQEKRSTTPDIKAHSYESITNEKRDNLIKVKPGKHEENENRSSNRRN